MRALVRVPATVANLGPGFDMLALALQLQNEVAAAAEAGEAIAVTVEPNDEALRDAERNLVARAYRAACDRLGVPGAERGVTLRCVNAIPQARGLGSSAAAALSGVLVAVALHRGAWGPAEIVDCAAAFEGHPDNVAAALLGGLVICAPEAEPVHVDVPDELRAVIFAPSARLLTAEARAAVATSFSRAEATFNAARCALLVRAITLGDHGALRVAMEDRWHQRQRFPLFPAMEELISAAYRAGADGACIAGAGPSVLALTAHGTAEVEVALRETAARLGVEGEVLVLRPRNFGARVEVRG